MHDVNVGVRLGADSASVEIKERMAALAPPVFIHAAPRTSSTWFWLKFRELPSALCYYEPFNYALNWMTPERAESLGGDSWESRHPKAKPYYREYVPLLRKANGVQHFQPAMTMQWYLPQGGLRGELRPAEKDYLSLLIEHANEAGKAPVFGDCWSLGRIRAIKQTYDGFHIFQYRNLWQQWLSYLSYKRRGSLTFYLSTVDIIWREDDPYFRYLVDRGLKHAAEPWSGNGPKPSPLYWNRMYENIPRDPDKVRPLEILPEHQAFAQFMGLYIYLYLHAQLCADLQADVTRMARDNGYRIDIEREIEQKTGLPVSFADVADVPAQTAVEFDQASVDWDEIREHARVAVEMLSKYGDPVHLAANAKALIDETIEEMRKGGARPAAPAKPPAARGKTIGLCMIVKNETKLIRRCLDSVLPVLDYILIVDTGSTDGTQQMIRDFLTEKKIDGAVIEEPWRDFAYNRSFALAKLREVESVDYAMIIDADDTLEIDAGFDPAAFKATLTADLYDVPVRHGSIAHVRPQLFSNRLPFSFKGVLHEYLEAPPGHLKRETAAGFAVRASTGGARSENPRKYQDDAALLERALTTETNPFLISRYTFYLAQSYRDCGEREKALANYLKRAELGNWAEEIYVSLFEAGNLMAALERPSDEVIATWERASKLVPGRVEALHAASRYCRDKGKNAQGMDIARRGLELKQPNGLFVQPWVYDYGLLDEFAINAYWAGAYRESLDACLKLLANDKLPASMVKRIAANARFATDKMPAAKAPNLGKLGEDNFLQQHKLVPQRPLHSRVQGAPRVLVAILAKQKGPALPLYLDCIEALDYPKSSMVLYIRTNNNTDKTEQILRDWVARVGHLYHSVEFDASNVAEKVEQYREHEWNATRFSVLGRIRNLSMRRAIELECDYYFVADVDNFIRPATLRELVALDLPIASPFLRTIAPGGYYSNYHAEIDKNGYYRGCDQYHWILNRHIRGVVEVPVVHCTYLIRTDVIPQLSYEDATGRHEYVVFADSARKAAIPQYFDNRQIYGYITFGEGDDHYVAGGIDQARALLQGAGDEAVLTSQEAAVTPSPAADFPIHLINLDRSTERLAAFRKFNAHLRNVIRVSAVDGRQLDRDTLIKEGLVDPNCSYKAGALACALSHVNLWKQAVAENMVMTVFEDDAIATERFEEKAARLIAGLPNDWDFVQWGYNFRPLFVWADFGFSKATMRFYGQQFQGDDKSKFKSSNFSPSTIKLAHSYGTVAYSVSPKGARALLDYCVPLKSWSIPFPGTDVVAENTGIDCTMNGIYGSMQAFISMPPLVLEDKTLDSDRVGMDRTETVPAASS
jgi:GR25 family glycosyltransferase involved in LPS biosynthesis/glycosyltransferase involved in cell wall biosynthesis